MTRRIRIDRLELDLRGIDPKTAAAATRRLGPALEQALAPRRGRESHDLASVLAQRIAQRVRRS